MAKLYNLVKILTWNGSKQSISPQAFAFSDWALNGWILLLL